MGSRRLDDHACISEALTAVTDKQAPVNHLAEEVVKHDATLQSREQAQMHFMAVHELFHQTGEHSVSESVRLCQAFLARDVPYARPSDMAQWRGEMGLLTQFLGHSWPNSHIDEVDELFRSYIRAGMMQVDVPLNCVASNGVIVVAHSALEYAVTQGKTRLIVALVEEGADYTAVPKYFHLRQDAGPVAARQGEFLEFIKHQTQFTAGHIASMYAAATAAVMRRRIGELDGDMVTDKGATAPLRARRASL